MRVKVGDEWFGPEPGRPIMVELTAEDRLNIIAMPPEAQRYAAFKESKTSAEYRAWIREAE